MQTTENKLYTIAYWMAVATIAYNLVEGVLATVLGFGDEELTLFGFGLDSFIEMISGAGILYMIIRIRKHDNTRRHDFEIGALKVTGYSFYALVALLLVSSVISIITGHEPQTTTWGIVISSISILVMLVLIYGKTRVGRQLNSVAILADAGCTKVCVYMSCVLLASSIIYEFTQFAYADSIGMLGLAWFSLQEGRECFEKVTTGTCCSDSSQDI